MAVGRTGMIAALDVGTTKVCCFVARAEADGLRVVGTGCQLSRGVRAGAIVDMEAAEAAIRGAVDAAERMADETVREVFVNVSGGRPASNAVAVEVPINGHEVSRRDVIRVVEQGRMRADPGDRAVIHAIPVGYTIDGDRGIRDPRGMYGERLGVTTHVVTAAAGATRNLRVCVERCHLDIAGLVVSPYASALATLVEDEKELGATFLDMGGGTTSIAVFHDGHFIYTDSVPVGGCHITSDIAQGLSTPLAHAERMKTLFGSAIASPSDERELIDVPLVGESAAEDANHIPRSLLNGIVRPRVEEILELVRGRLEAVGLDRRVGRRLVLAGGASQLQGMRELAARVLDKQVRTGRPAAMAGLATAAAGPAFAVCAGLLRYAAEPRDEAAGTAPWMAAKEPGGRFARVGKWLLSNF